MKRPGLMDPTLLLQLRKAFVRELALRFKLLDKAISEYLERNAFSLDLSLNYDPNEKRDKKGRWTDGAERMPRSLEEIRVKGGGGETVLIYINPTLQQAKQFMAKHGGKDPERKSTRWIKGVVSVRTGDIVLWNGNQWLHDEIARSVGIKGGYYTITVGSPKGLEEEHALVKEEMKKPIKKRFEGWVENFNPDEPRDKSGKWARSIESSGVERLQLPRGRRVNVLRNPSLTQALVFTKGMKPVKDDDRIIGMPFRALVDNHGNVYLWKSIGAAHEEIEEQLYLMKGTPTSFGGDVGITGDGSVSDEIEMMFKLALHRRTTHNVHNASTTQQISHFQDWLALQMSTLLDKGNRNDENEYWRKYIEQAHSKGTGRSFDQTKVPKIKVGDARELDKHMGDKQEFLNRASREALQKVKLLSARSLAGLEGVTQTLASQLATILIDGMSTGKSVKGIARAMSKQIGKSLSYAEGVAQTEITRAHAAGQLAAMRALGHTHVGVMVEWKNTGENVCPQCRALRNVVLTLEEAEGLIPRHPRCKCAFVPAAVGESKRWQKRTKRQIEQAVGKSLREETHDKSTKTARKHSRWSGAKIKLRDRRKTGRANNATNSDGAHYLRRYGRW